MYQYYYYKHRLFFRRLLQTLPIYAEGKRKLLKRTYISNEL